MKVCIDAGWIGEGVFSYREGERMFLLQKFLKTALMSYGMEVVCTRQTRADAPSEEACAVMAEGCDLFLGLRTGVTGQAVDHNTDHVRVYYPLTRRGQELAREMSEVVSAVMGTEQEPRFVVSRNAYPLLNEVQTGLVILHGFRTNPKTVRWLMDDDHLRTLAQAEASLVADYYGLEAPEMRYQYLKDIKCDQYRAAVEKLLALGLLPSRGGRGGDTLVDLGEDAIRLLVLLVQAGVIQ